MTLLKILVLQPNFTRRNFINSYPHNDNLLMQYLIEKPYSHEIIESSIQSFNPDVIYLENELQHNLQGWRVAHYLKNKYPRLDIVLFDISLSPQPCDNADFVITTYDQNDYHEVVQSLIKRKNIMENYTALNKNLTQKNSGYTHTKI